MTKLKGPRVAPCGKDNLKTRDVEPQKCLMTSPANSTISMIYN